MSSMEGALSTLGSLSVSVAANYSDSGDSTGARSADNATPPMHFLTPHVEISMADAPASFSPIQVSINSAGSANLIKFMINLECYRISKI